MRRFLFCSSLLTAALAGVPVALPTPVDPASWAGAACLATWPTASARRS